LRRGERAGFLGLGDIAVFAAHRCYPIDTRRVFAARESSVNVNTTGHQQK
jgi:hypothetical protein